MAREVVVAVKNGNWSDPTTWNTGTLPDSTDQVFANGYVVTIDQDITIRHLSNNNLPLNEVPYMTSMTEPAGEVIFGSADYYPNENSTTLWPYRVFRDFVREPGYWYANEEDNNYVGYDFGYPIVLNSYMVFASGAYFAANFGFEAWDGNDWIRLHTETTGTSNYKINNVGNTTAYTKYRWYTDINSSVRLEVYEVRFWYTRYTSDISINGKFIAQDGVTINTTEANSLIYATGYGPYSSLTSEHLIEYSGTESLNINSDFVYNTTDSPNLNRRLVNILGDGEVTVVGNVYIWGANTWRSNLYRVIQSIGNQGTLNLIGSFDKIYADTGVLNITGDVIQTRVPNVTNSLVSIQVAGSTVCNITGDLYQANTTGNTRVGWAALSISSTAKCYHTGALYNIDSSLYTAPSHYHYVVRNDGYYNQIGLQQNSPANHGTCLWSAGFTAKNILTGPFIPSNDGSMPFLVANLFIQRVETYLQLKDNSTDGYYDYGNPSPEQIGTYTLYSALSLVDLPLEEDVRKNTQYGNSNYTGTLAVPLPGQVSLGIPTDDTVGTAILTGENVWNVQTTALNVAGSVGVRLKNVATIGMVGAQLEAFLKKD